MARQTANQRARKRAPTHKQKMEAGKADAIQRLQVLDAQRQEAQQRIAQIDAASHQMQGRLRFFMEELGEAPPLEPVPEPEPTLEPDPPDEQ